MCNISGSVCPQNGDHDLSMSAIAADFSPIGVIGSLQRHDRANESSECLLFNPICDHGQLPAVGLDDEEGIFDALFFDTFTLGSNRDQASSGLKCAPGSLERFSADAVKNDIDLLQTVFKRCA